MSARHFQSLLSLRLRAADYPEKPVTVISDAGAGASVDVATRIVADGLSKMWGQTVAVVNHPGANGSIAAHAASDATGDGYTSIHSGEFHFHYLAVGGA